ncbi:MAG: flotillin-like FloA family protein, partial [Chthoniobacterales bacterium]
MSSIIVTAAIGLAFVVGLVLVVILFNFFGIWLRAKIADAPVSFARLVGMRLRRVPVGMIVDSRITAVKAGIPLDTD